MTLAIRTSDGVLWIGGVWCNECGRDTRVSNKTGKCIAGHPSPYKARGTVVKGTSNQDRSPASEPKEDA